MSTQGEGLNVVLRQIRGPWNDGWVLDKHTLRSVYIGENEYGHSQFETTRTEVGEATYQLKYRGDWAQAKPLAKTIADHIYPRFSQVGFILPMPATTPRLRQPVTEVSKELGALVGVPVFDNVLLKAAQGTCIKNLQSKEEKVAAIGNSFSVNDVISEGKWNVLVVDDLFHTGASMEAACQVLRGFRKVRNIYVAALTWR